MTPAGALEARSDTTLTEVDRSAPQELASDRRHAPPEQRHAADDGPEAAASADAHQGWHAVFLDGIHCGYEHFRWRTAQRDGRPVREVQWELVLRVLRQGQYNQTEIRAAGFESPGGPPLEIHCRNGVGDLDFVARARQGVLHRRSTSGAASRDALLPLPADARGFLAVEQSLVEQPPAPGDRRRLRVFHVVFGQFVEVELVARHHETVACLGTSRRLLAVDATLALPAGQTLQSRLWVDTRGVIWKTQAQGVSIPQVAYRTTRAAAIGCEAQQLPDIGRAAMVPVARPLPDVHRRHAARYRVTLREGDPARSFASDQRQQVTPRDEHTADIVVRRLQPPEAADAGSSGGVGPPRATSAADAPIGIYLAPSDLVQSDDPLVVALASEAAEGHRDPYRVALALERWVHGAMRRVDYGTTFASAAEVAHRLQGDCTEHAVLLAALCRARGIPARLALGLVYVPSAQAFAFHMWCEAQVRGTWVPLDATLGLGGIGAGHLKLADTALEDRQALAVLLRVVEIVGQVHIEPADEP